MEDNQKYRLDVYLVNKGLSKSRERSQGLISAGLVFVDGKRAVKSSQQVDEKSRIEIKGNDLPYVGRGGLKLEKALREFNVDASGKICVDIGSSTGGFTDCLLQNGAKKVFAVDVGYGQLDWKLRNDKRVVVMEKTNARNLKKEDFGDVIDLAVIDVSFISLKKILPAAKEIVKPDGIVIALIKPQFEVGKEKVGKGGIVRDLEARKKAVENISDFSKEIGFDIMGIIESPIKGADGNVEFLMKLEIKPSSASSS